MNHTEVIYHGEAKTAEEGKEDRRGVLAPDSLERQAYCPAGQPTIAAEEMPHPPITSHATKVYGLQDNFLSGPTDHNRRSITPQHDHAPAGHHLLSVGLPLKERSLSDILNGLIYMQQNLPFHKNREKIREYICSNYEAHMRILQDRGENTLYREFNTWYEEFRSGT